MVTPDRVRLKVVDFRRGLRAVKAMGGRFDPATKSWLVPADRAELDSLGPRGLARVAGSGFGDEYALVAEAARRFVDRQLERIGASAAQRGTEARVAVELALAFSLRAPTTLDEARELRRALASGSLRAGYAREHVAWAQPIITRLAEAFGDRGEALAGLTAPDLEVRVEEVLD